MIVGLKDQARNVILLRRDERVGYNFLKLHIGQSKLGCHALLLRSGRKAGQLVARLFFIGPGKNVSQVTELKAFKHLAVTHYPLGKPKVTNRKENKDQFLKAWSFKPAGCHSFTKLSLFLLAFALIGGQY